MFVCNSVRSAAIANGLEVDAAGAHTGIDALLRGTFRHTEYVVEAFERRQRRRDGGYHAFATNERAVQVGDIIVLDRHAARARDVVAFRNIPTTLPHGRNLHGDVVVSVDDTNGYAETVGGNVGDSVRRRRYPLAANGFLVIRRGR